DGVEAVEQVAERANTVLDVASHVLAGVELRLLRQQPDRGAGCELRAAGRRLVETRHDAQQRRFPGAVGAEYADLRPGRNESEMFARTWRSGPKNLSTRNIEYT